MIINNYKRLMNTFGLVEDMELDMIGCSLIIVLRDILMFSILAITCMQICIYHMMSRLGVK